MIKKKIFCLWAAALILSGCAGVFQGKEKETEPDFVLTYAENQAEDYPTTQGADKFAELVKEKTEGKVEILVNAGGSLGDEKSVIEQLQFGGIDFYGSRVHSQVKCTSDALFVYRRRSHVESTGRSYWR